MEIGEKKQKLLDKYRYAINSYDDYLSFMSFLHTRKKNNERMRFLYDHPHYVLILKKDSYVRREYFDWIHNGLYRIQKESEKS